MLTSRHNVVVFLELNIRHGEMPFFLHKNGVIQPWDLDRVALRYYITTEQAPDDVSLCNLFINTKRNMIWASHQLLSLVSRWLLHSFTFIFNADLCIFSLLRLVGLSRDVLLWKLWNNVGVKRKTVLKGSEMEVSPSIGSVWDGLWLNSERKVSLAAHMLAYRWRWGDCRMLNSEKV